MNGQTPDAAYAATPKAGPRGLGAGAHYRLRLDHVDAGGKASLRRAGRMHHLGIGHAHRGTAILMLIDATIVTVTSRTTGEVLSQHDIEPTKTYWRNKNREPGRWPDSQR